MYVLGIPVKNEVCVGSRSAYLQRALKEQLGFDKVGNLTYGIADYPGEIERG